ncbi:MAG TPA: DUF1343 domain-containing protein [Verrucomicrobiota bacterium]|nr:hypothetical protein [Verrucomicrobiales bacterium]HRI13436.1 DUF1343 domain-containing protein [Verrucomicrobiota bacterium]
MRFEWSVGKCFWLALWLVGSLSNTQSAPALDPSTEFRAAKLAAIEAAVTNAIAAHKLPGGVLWLERRGTAFHRAFGQRSVVPTAEVMTEDTIFDVASLTKVIATAPALMKLVEQGRVELDAPVSRYLPEFTGDGKEAITVRQLLTHSSGLRSGLPSAEPWTGATNALLLAAEEPLADPPGTRFRYSDINFILLGLLVERVTGEHLEVFTTREIFAPLGMTNTHYRRFSATTPLGLPANVAATATNSQRIAPTEVLSDEIVLRGVVHDPTARRMNGVAGHAGLFTTAADLARFARMFLNGGTVDGQRVLQPSTVALMTSVQSPPGLPRRGLGWDIDSPYAGQRGSVFPLGGYGHTGWTGTSLWIDPFSQTFLIFLSNRNHPTEDGNVIALRRELGTLAAEAVRHFNFVGVSGALPPDPARTNQPAAATPTPPPPDVLNGIDVLARDHFTPLRGLKIGLITNQTGRDRNRRSTIDLLKSAPEVELRALFSPEHGIRGVLDQEGIGDEKDEATGLPIYSLYGERRAPKPDQLADLDALVFDIQDVGCRFYTYISTLGNCLEAAAHSQKKFFVLDRVNPIGSRIEGPVAEGEFSFVAWHAIPLRHGMTVGELARLFNAERKFEADLTVIPISGWKPTEWFDETGLPWVNPSPNMRSLTAATLYPGVGLLEYCQLSVGRGTGTPFEVVGAPYVDDRKLAAELNAAKLPGVRFVPIRFTPTASVFSGQECGGVQLLLTDRNAFRAADLGVVLATVLHRLYLDALKVEKMQALLQSSAVLEAIKAGKPLPEIRALWVGESARFEERQKPFLLYPR